MDKRRVTARIYYFHPLTVFLAIALISLVMLIVAPLPNATSETSVEEKEQAALTFLNTVAGVDTSAYAIDLIYRYIDEQPVKEWSFVIYLSDQEKSIRVLLDVEHEVVSYFKCDDVYALSTARQSKPILDIARETVQALYANVVEGPSFAAQCVNLIDMAAPGQNQSLKSGNLVLEVKEDGRLLEWGLMANGLYAYGPLWLSFSDEGHLMRLSNGCGIYSVSSLPITVSEEIARSIALNYATSYAQKNSRSIASTTARLRYDLAVDRYTFRPIWYVEVAFEPAASNVFGYSLLLFADTKAVLSLGPVEKMGSGIQSDFTPPFLVLAGVILVAATLLVVLRKRRVEADDSNH